MNKIEEIIKLTGKEIRFDTPVSIKPTPHSEWIGIDRIEINRGVVWMQLYKSRFSQALETGNWFPLEQTDPSFDMIANSILQRLRLLKKALA